MGIGRASGQGFELDSDSLATSSLRVMTERMRDFGRSGPFALLGRVLLVLPQEAGPGTGGADARVVASLHRLAAECKDDSIAGPTGELNSDTLVGNLIELCTAAREWLRASIRERRLIEITGQERSSTILDIARQARLAHSTTSSGVSYDLVDELAASSIDALIDLLVDLLWSSSPWHLLGMCTHGQTRALTDTTPASLEIWQFDLPKVQEDEDEGAFDTLRERIATSRFDDDEKELPAPLEVRAELLADAIAAVADDRSGTHASGILVRRLVVVGAFIWNRRSMSLPLTFSECTFVQARASSGIRHDEYDPANGDQGTVRGLVDFAESHLAALTLERCVLGRLSLEGAQVDGPVRVERSSATSFILTGSRISHEVRLSNIGWLLPEERTRPSTCDQGLWMQLSDGSHARTPRLEAKYLECGGFLAGGEFGEINLVGSRCDSGIFLGGPFSALHANSVQMGSAHTRVLVCDQTLIHGANAGILMPWAANVEASVHLSPSCVIQGRVDFSDLQCGGTIEIDCNVIEPTLGTEVDSSRPSLRLDQASACGIKINAGDADSTSDLVRKRMPGGISMEEVSTNGDVTVSNVDLGDADLIMIGLQSTGRVKLNGIAAKRLDALGLSADALSMKNCEIRWTRGPADLSSPDTSPRPERLPRWSVRFDRAIIARRMEISGCLFDSDLSFDHSSVGDLVVGVDPETQEHRCAGTLHEDSPPRTHGNVFTGGILRARGVRVIGEFTLCAVRPGTPAVARVGIPLRLSEARVDDLRLCGHFEGPSSGPVILTGAELHYLRLETREGPVPSSIHLLNGTALAGSPPSVRSDAYLCLTKMLARNGKHAEAISLAVAGERQEHDAKKPTGLVPRLMHLAWGVWGTIADFGYRPGKALWGLFGSIAAAVVLVLLGWQLGWFVYTGSEDVILSSSPKCPPTGPCFSVVPYLLQTLIPGLGLGQVEAWAPTTWVLGTALALCTMSAWALSLIGALALASSSRRDLSTAS